MVPRKLLYQIEIEDFSDARNRFSWETHRNVCEAQRTRKDSQDNNKAVKQYSTIPSINPTDHTDVLLIIDPLEAPMSVWLAHHRFSTWMTDLQGVRKLYK